VAEIDVVTGAFSYTGRHIAEALLTRGRRVRTLTRRPPDPSHPLAGSVEVAQFTFDDVLVESLHGADTLYNTYWVRFERGATTFERAVENTAALFAAAKQAGIRRVVHISVANPDTGSPFPYFRGKAQTEEALRETGLSHAIVRPTLVFGPEDILVNNIAWGLRHVPIFLIAGDGGSEVQPVSVRDTASICIEAGTRDENVVLDAAGPERWAYEDFVRLIARAVGGRARIRHSSMRVALYAARTAGVLLRDVVVTRDELAALGAGLLVSHEEPLGSDRFETWLMENADRFGRRYHSELARNFRG
jgi:NADH dehydrogenase